MKSQARLRLWRPMTNAWLLPPMERKRAADHSPTTTPRVLSELDAVVVERDSLRQCIEDLKRVDEARLTVLTRATAERDAAIARAEQAEAERDRLREQLAEAESERDRIKLDSERWQESAEGVLATLTHVRSERDRLREQLAQFDAELSRLRQSERDLAILMQAFGKVKS